MTFNPETLKGLTNVNNEVYFNERVTFFGDVNLENVTLKGQLSSSGSVTFLDNVTFSDNVTFNSNVTAGDISVQNVVVGGAVTVTSLTVGGELVDGDGNFGSAGQVLSSDGDDLAWINTSDANVGSATNVGVNLNATDESQWITFVGANSGNNPIRVDDGLRYNPSTNTMSELNYSGTSRFNNIRIDGQLLDGDGDFGSSGQVLASDGTNTNWVNTGTLSAGSASQVSVTEVDTNATLFITFVDVTSGSDNIKVDDQFTYNASTNTLTAGTFSGSGANLTSLNATNLSSGTIPDARFPATLPTISGANLTSLNATNLSSGTVNVNRLGSSGTRNNTTFLRGDNTWASPTLNISSLPTLP